MTTKNFKLKIFELLPLPQLIPTTNVVHIKHYLGFLSRFQPNPCSKIIKPTDTETSNDRLHCMHSFRSLFAVDKYFKY